MNRLTLVIVNEGKTYKERCDIARKTASSEYHPGMALKAWALTVSTAAINQSIRFHEVYTVKELAETVIELADYYADHINE